MQFDVHAHLDLYEKRDSVIREIEQQKIYVISMTNLPRLYEKYILDYPSLSYVRFALGLHPELVVNYANQLPLFISLLSKARYVGEIGLDFSGQKSSAEKRLQIEVFEQIISHCKKCSAPKILSIHSRNAANDIIDIIGTYHGNVILHWLSDRNVRIHDAIDYGYYFSVNSQMVSCQSGQNLIRKMPLDRLLIESDAPFTNGNVTKYTVEKLSDTVKQLAAIWGISLGRMKNTLSENFINILTNENRNS